MYRIINSLATAEFNKEIGAVEVNFNGQGDASLYHTTMDIAMNIAVIYNTNRWLFVKDFFHDIDVKNFLFFVRKWSRKCKDQFDPGAENVMCKVALLTTADSYKHLSQEYDWIEESSTQFSDLSLQTFLDRNKAYSYLASRIEEKIFSA